MKSTDILTALGGVSERYKTEAEEENADKIFKKSEKKGAGLRVFKFVLSGAALLGLCAFAIFIGVAKNRDNITASMLDRGANIPHTFIKEEFSKISYTVKGEKDSAAKVTVPVCELKTDGGAQTVWGDDYIVDAGQRLLAVENEYRYSYDINEEKRYIIKKSGEKEVYRYEIKDIPVSMAHFVFKELNGGLVIAFYQSELKVSEETAATLEIIMLNGDGTERWRVRRKDPVGSNPDQILQMYFKDGKIYVVGFKTEFGSASDCMICRGFTVTAYNEKTGELISRKTSDTEIKTQMLGTHCIGMTEYGFIITAVPEKWADEAYMILVGFDAEILSIVRYNAYYEFYSAASINGEIYLSGKKMSPVKNISSITGSEMFSVDPRKYRDVYNNQEYYIPGVNRFKKFSGETSAALMVCDNTLTPVKVYTQSGSFGGCVRVEGDKLLWDACLITDVYPDESQVENNSLYVTIHSAAQTYEINGSGVMETRYPTATSYRMIGLAYDHVWEE